MSAWRCIPGTAGQGGGQPDRPRLRSDKAYRSRRDRKADADNSRCADDVLDSQRRRQIFCHSARDVHLALPGLSALNVMRSATQQSAILSALIFNAVIIPLLIPLALRGVRFRPTNAEQNFYRNLVDIRRRRARGAVHRHQADRCVLVGGALRGRRTCWRSSCRRCAHRQSFGSCWNCLPPCRDRPSANPLSRRSAWQYGDPCRRDGDRLAFDRPAMDRAGMVPRAAFRDHPNKPRRPDRDDPSALQRGQLGGIEPGPSSRILVERLAADRKALEPRAA